MTIKSVLYDIRTSLALDADLNRRLRALAWILDHEGRISTLMRSFLREAVDAQEEKMKQLEPQMWEEYQSVLNNLVQADLIKSQSLADTLTDLKETNDDESEGTNDPATGSGE